MKKILAIFMMLIMTSGISNAVTGEIRVTDTTENTATIKFSDILGGRNGNFKFYYTTSAISAGTGEPNRIISSNATSLETEGSEIKYVLTGLSPQTVYTLRIEAEDEEGEILLEAPMQVTFTTKIKINEPIRTSESTWKLSWGNISLNPTEAEDCLVVYHVYRKNLETESFEIVGGGATNNLYVRLKGDEMIFQIQAAVDLDRDGTTDIRFMSNTVEKKFEDRLMPLVPDIQENLGIEREEVEKDYIKILWETQAIEDAVYDIYLAEKMEDLENRRISPVISNFSPGSDNYVYDIDDNIVGYRYYFENLLPNKMYYLKIVAKNKYGESEPAIKTFVTKADIKDTKPLVVSAPPFDIMKDLVTGRESVGDTWVDVTWKNKWIEKWNTQDLIWEYDKTATDDDVDGINYRTVGYGEDIKFAIGYEEYSKFEPSKINNYSPKIESIEAKEDIVEYKIEKLKAETNYIMWIKAYREGDRINNYSDASKTIIFSTYNDMVEPLIIPMVPTITNIETTDEDMKITANFETDKTYIIMYGTDEALERVNNKITFTSKNLDKDGKLTIKGLIANTRYYLWIQAESKTGNQTMSSAWSDSYEVRTLDIEMPNTPSAFGINEAKTKTDSISFEWHKDEDMIYELQISKTKDFTDKQVFSSIDDSEYVVEKLESNTRYYARLYTINKRKRGYSEPSAVIIVRTLKEEGDYTDGREEEEKEILPVIIKTQIKKSVVTVDMSDIDNEVFVEGLNNATNNRYEIKYASNKDNYEYKIGSELLKLLNSSKKEIVFGDNEFEIGLEKGMYELKDGENLVIRVEKKSLLGRSLASGQKNFGDNYNIEILKEKSKIYNKAVSKTGLKLRVLYNKHNGITQNTTFIGKSLSNGWEKLNTKVIYSSFGNRGTIEARICESGEYTVIIESIG